MSLRKVPALNLNDFLSSDIDVRRKFERDLFESFTEYGFVVLKEHPISESLLDEAYRLQANFFNLPIEQKLAYQSPDGGQRGYTPYRTENAKGSKTKDLKEFWHIGRELDASSEDWKKYPPNLWPTEIDQFKEIFLKIYLELEKTGNLILSALEPSLGVEPGFFKPRMHNGNSILRLLHYPALADSVIEPGAIRAEKHSDINTITVLVASRQSGLQLLDNTGEWIDVDSAENNLVVNIGDMLNRIAPQLKSTIHRVINPEGIKIKEPRYSMPFFHHFRSEVKLAPIDINKNLEPVITADDYLMERLREIGLKK